MQSNLKRFIALMLSLCLCLSFNIQASAETITSRGVVYDEDTGSVTYSVPSGVSVINTYDYGNDIVCTYYDNGDLVFSGTGVIPEIALDPLAEGIEGVLNVAITDGITGNDNEFLLEYVNDREPADIKVFITGSMLDTGCNMLATSMNRNYPIYISTLYLGEGMKTIGEFFADGSQVRGALVIPSTVTLIEEYALYGTYCGRSIYFKDRSDTVSLETKAIDGCPHIRYLRLSNNMVVGSKNFRGMTRIKYLDVPADITFSGTSVFTELANNIQYIIFRGDYVSLDEESFHLIDKNENEVLVYTDSDAVRAHDFYGSDAITFRGLSEAPAPEFIADIYDHYIIGPEDGKSYRYSFDGNTVEDIYPDGYVNAVYVPQNYSSFLIWEVGYYYGANYRVEDGILTLLNDYIEIPFLSDSSSIKVKYSESSSYEVILPKSITLDSKTYASSYSVTVKGDILQDEVVRVEPVDESDAVDGINVVMRDIFDNETIATVIQAKTHWYKNEIAGSGSTVKGNTVSASDIPVGEWEGTITFKIGLDKIV